MAGKKFELTEYTLSIIEEIGGHMPGGFFIYKAREPQEQIGLPYILKQFETRDQFSVSFMRALESGGDYMEHILRLKNKIEDTLRYCVSVCEQRTPFALRQSRVTIEE